MASMNRQTTVMAVNR